MRYVVVKGKNGEMMNPATEETLKKIAKSYGFIPAVIGGGYYIKGTYFDINPFNFGAVPITDKAPNAYVNEMYTPPQNIRGRLCRACYSGGYVILPKGKDVSIKFRGTKLIILALYKDYDSSQGEYIDISITDSAGDRNYHISYNNYYGNNSPYHMIRLLEVEDLSDEEHTLTISATDTDFWFEGIFVEKYKNLAVDIDVFRASMATNAVIDIKGDVSKIRRNIEKDILGSAINLGKYEGNAHLSGNSVMKIYPPTGPKTEFYISIYTTDKSINISSLSIYTGMIFSAKEIRGKGYTVNSDDTITIDPNSYVTVVYDLYNGSCVEIENPNSDETVVYIKAIGKP